MPPWSMRGIPMDPREVPATDEASTELEDMAALIRFARSLGLESALTEREPVPNADDQRVSHSGRSDAPLTEANG